ncbi:hypothetical protein QB607_003850 [Clostridium botulinum]|nr:hypothetical protein [Clostridium botulinum]EKS4396726.1 hypothetical protein [Clostridium botulinum]
MKFYELHEVIQELRKNEKLVFKIVLVKNGEMIDDGLGELHDDHYLTIYHWAKSPYIRALRFHNGEFRGFYEGIQFDEKCRWVLTSDLDNWFTDSKINS